MIPCRVKVIRLFQKDEIEKEIPKDLTDNWISVSDKTPESSNVFYVRNGQNISKAIYIFGYPNPQILPSKWVHVTKDEFIDDQEITHWMDIKQQT